MSFKVPVAVEARLAPRYTHLENLPQTLNQSHNKCFLYTKVSLKITYLNVLMKFHWKPFSLFFFPPVRPTPCKIFSLYRLQNASHEYIFNWRMANGERKASEAKIYTFYMKVKLSDSGSIKPLAAENENKFWVVYSPKKWCLKENWD